MIFGAFTGSSAVHHAARLSVADTSARSPFACARASTAATALKCGTNGTEKPKWKRAESRIAASPAERSACIENGACTLSPSPERDPKLSLTMGPVEFLKVVSGAGNPVMMFMTGKLKAKGDLGLAANIANLFDIPKG